MGDAQAADAPLPTGRLLTYADITPALKNRQAEVCQQCCRAAHAESVINLCTCCLLICASSNVTLDSGLAAILARRQNVVSHRGGCHQCTDKNSQVSPQSLAQWEQVVCVLHLMLLKCNHDDTQSHRLIAGVGYNTQVESWRTST